MAERLSDEELKEELKKAGNIIKDAKLPEELQKIAFSRMMDDILGHSQPLKNRTKSNKKKGYKNRNPKGENEEAKKLKEESDLIIDSLSRSTHSIIYKLVSALDQSLFILQIAEKEKSIRGLTPGQISTILKSVFKIMKTQAAVSMALMKAVEYTDKKKIKLGGTFAYKYEIMHKGEDYIDKKIGKIKEEDNSYESSEESAQESE